MSGGIKRVCILGLDSLEHDLVEKWDMKTLKQKEYGKVRLPLSKSELAYTPPIWASFITGKDPKEHGIQSDRKWDSVLIESAGKLKKKLVRDWGFKRFLSLPTKTLAIKLGFKYRTIDKNDLKMETIFDWVGNYVAISVPGYNEWDEILEVRNLLQEARSHKIPASVARDKGLEVFKNKRDVFFKKLKGEWKIFMVHFFLLDVIHHLYPSDEDYIKENYEMMCELVKKTKRKINEKEVLMLIISDHGQKEGLHTKYGFYSSNEKLGLKNPKMTDFFNIIENLLDIISKEKREKIRKRLIELGY